MALFEVVSDVIFTEQYRTKRLVLSGLGLVLILLAACSSPEVLSLWSDDRAVAFVDGQLSQSGESVDTCGEGYGYSIMQRKCVKIMFPWQDRVAFRKVADAFISGQDFSVIEIREGVYQENEIGVDADGAVVLVSDLTLKNYRKETVTIQNDSATRVTFVLHNEAENLHFQGLHLLGVRSELVRGWEPVPGHPNVWRVLYTRGLVQKLYNEGIYGWPVVCVLSQGDSNISSCLADIYSRERFFQDYQRDEAGEIIGMNGYLYIYSDGDPNEEEIIVGGNYAMGSSGGNGGLVELDRMTLTGFSHSGVKGNYGWWIHDSYFADLGLDDYDHHIYTQTVASPDNPVIIERNYFGGAMGCAIKLAPEPPVNPLPEYYIIRFNIFDGNASCGLFLGSRHSEIYNNTFYNSGIGIWFYNPRSDEYGVPASRDNRIFNNIMDGNTTGDMQVYYFDGDLSPGHNEVWNNFLGSDNPCVNCYCEYAHYGAENNFVSELNPFGVEAPEGWADLYLDPNFPWIDQGVASEIPGEEAFIAPSADAAWPPKAATQSAYGEWDLGAYLAEGGSGQIPQVTPEVVIIDPHDPQRDFPRLSQAPEPLAENTSKPNKGFVLYPNDFEATFNEMTFFWLADPIAHNYELWIEVILNGVQQTLYEKTVTARDAHCEAGQGICYFRPEISFDPGKYVWWIQGQTGTSLGDWSEGMTFQVGGAERLCYVALVSPAESGSGSPEFVWKVQPDAEAYQLYVSEAYSGFDVFTQWYTAAEANCDQEACRVSPSLTLEDGQYRWEMQSKAGDVLSPWSRSMVFTVMENPPQEIPEPVHPIYLLTERQVTFYWYDVPLATEYTISVKDAQGQVVVERCFTKEEANCNWQCSVTLPETFEDGSYSWQVRANNAVGMGQWSNALSFQIDGPPDSPPDAPIPQSPVDAVLQPGTVTFSWSSSLEVQEYYVWIEDTNRKIWVDTMVLPADLGCAAGPVCMFTPQVSFTPGEYVWFVTARNQAGYAQWDEGVPFTIGGDGNP
jgi:hypothetical protein